MLTDEPQQLLVVDTNSSNEHRYSEVPLDSFAHHNKKHISKVTAVYIEKKGSVV